MDYRRNSLVLHAQQQLQARRNSHIYSSFAGASDAVAPSSDGLWADVIPINMWWDDERIEATVNRQFVLSKLRPDEQVRLDEPVGFGDGLTDDTYMEWIEEKAKRIFLILVDLGVPDQIFGVIDDSWDDDDLPVPFNQVERLQLTYDKDEKVERKFFQRQFLYLLRNLQKGDHTYYDDVEVVPLELAEKRPVGGLIQSNVDKVHLPGKPDNILLRRRIAIGTSAGRMSQEDFLHGIESMKAIEHEHLTSLWASYQHQDYGYLLLTPVNDNNLKSFLTITPQSIKILPKQDRRILLLNWLHCLAEALSFLHSKHLSHRNIKPSNVMLDTDNNIFLGDTGIFPTTSVVGEKKGFDQESYNYTAPEQNQPTTTAPTQIRSGPQRQSNPPSRGAGVFTPVSPTFPPSDTSSIYTSSTSSDQATPTSPASRKGRPDPQKSDVFALGAIFLEILTFLMKRASRNFSSHRSSKNKTPGRGGGLPDSSFHKNLGQVEKWMDILAKDASKKEDKLFRGVSHILNLVAKMLNQEPSERPTAEEVAERLRDILTTYSGFAPETVHCMERETDVNQWNFGFDELRLASQKAAAEACAITAATGVPVISNTPPVIAKGLNPYEVPGLRSPGYGSTSFAVTGGDGASIATKTSGGSGGKSTDGKSRSSSGKEGTKAKPKAKAWKAPVYQEISFG